MTDFNPLSREIRIPAEIRCLLHLFSMRESYEYKYYCSR